LKTRFDLIGISSVFDGDQIRWCSDLKETSDDIRLRMAVEHGQQEMVELATQELLALYCCGPAGGGGVRRHHSRRLKTMSYLAPRDQVFPTIDITQGEARDAS
jgi:hypothetical protein